MKVLALFVILASTSSVLAQETGIDLVEAQRHLPVEQAPIPSLPLPPLPQPPSFSPAQPPSLSGFPAMPTLPGSGLSFNPEPVPEPSVAALDGDRPHGPGIRRGRRFLFAARDDRGDQGGCGDQYLRHWRCFSNRCR